MNIKRTNGVKINDAHMNIGKFPYFDFPDNTLWDSKESAEQLILKMNVNGINKAVVCSFESMFYDYNRGNRELSEIQKCFEDRLIALATVHPLIKTAKDDFINAIDVLGLKGIKLNSLYQRFNPLCKEVFDLLEICQSKNLPVMFHCGSLHKETSVDVLLQVAREFKTIPFILAHMGGTNPYLTAEKAYKFDNVFLETSVSSHVFNPIKSIVCKVGEDRVIYGSDFPCGSPSLEIFRILDANLTSTQIEKILYKNFERIFK